MVWQRFAKSPRIACAGSSPAASAKVSAVRSSDSTGGCQRSSLTAGRFGTCSSAESERDSAKVEVARSNRARSTKLKSYGVAELERREFLKLVYVGSNPTSVASLKSLTRSTLES
jgi:hypothetical protein